MIGLTGTRHGVRTFATALVLLTSCTPDSTGIRRLPFEPGAAPAAVTITPEGTSLGYIGEQLQFTAKVLDGDGQPAQGLSFVWISANSGVVNEDHPAVDREQFTGGIHRRGVRSANDEVVVNRGEVSLYTSSPKYVAQLTF